MTEHDHKDYAASSAKHLANLLGREVAGYLPDYAKEGKPYKIDIDIELFRNNVGVASLVILSALIKDKRRDYIIKNIKPEYFQLFDRYLLEIILEMLTNGEVVDYLKIKNQIPEYSLKYFSSPSAERSLEGYYFTLEQILDLDPTPTQIGKAIGLLQRKAKKRGLKHSKDE